MRGFIDLVFRFDGLFYIVDWKSNWLGNRPSDYDQPNLRSSIQRHYYFLQYHLYAVAADLFLRARIPGYDYKRHFGGVFYIFLRGVDPAMPERGIFRDRPDASLIRDLARNFDREAGMKTLPVLLDQREFTDIDRHFAKFIGGFGGPELAVIAAAALSRNLRSGHICLDLVNGPAHFDEEIAGFPWPALETWQAALKKSRAVGGPDEERPLVLDHAGRLYLRRYWEYEKSLARAILGRCDEPAAAVSKSGDLQQTAIETALARRLLVISGGPGTGKTTTVLKILERMVAQPGNERLRIALAAPTGKAAARLEESLRGGKLQNHLPKTASTLHRLLGARPDSAALRHNAKNPLPVDVMVVDEASMVPLTMMAKLFDALPAKARVILLGDSHQLASVEPGYVLGDIAEAASTPGSLLQGSLVALQKNYRFGNSSAIFALSSAVRDGNTDRAFEILGAGNQPDLAAFPTPAAVQLMQELKPRIIAGYSAYLQERDPGEALKKFRQFRVLCALRSGPHGVESMNRKIEAILRAEGLIPAAPASCGTPVLITRNDPGLRLFNGDTGILLPDETGILMAWFADGAGGLRHFAPARLPGHEPAFAMTVHKSQGSEYDDVLLVLPPQKPNPVCTRELVYTGLTRARNKVELWFREPVLRAAIETPVPCAACRVCGRRLCGAKRIEFENPACQSAGRNSGGGQ